MPVIKVVKKNSEIDGKPIEWNVLAITGYLGGDYQTLELKLSKTEAMLANMLLETSDKAPETTSRPANSEEKDGFLKQQKNTDSLLDDEDELN